MATSHTPRASGISSRPSSGHGYNGFGTARTLVIGITRLLFATLPVASVSASPMPPFDVVSKRSSVPWLSADDDVDDPDVGAASVWVLYIASAILVLLGGAFAGLTIALMGQDSIYLQVLARDDTDPQQKNARRVHDLLQRGKHWVLVTLLLSNVIVNETLPVVLDRCLGGGVAAVVGSTLLIVVFGEVLPQSICVRYGLQIGGVMAKPVLALMWLLAPIAWPTAKVLDHALGEDHGTVYKKSGLKTLVTLHRSLGEVSERLNQDEVTIISAVLDLKEKPVSSVMTPMEDVFTMSEDTVLDEKMMDMILSAGYSRIPIYEPMNPTNFVGMLLVKILITYDPDDKMRVSEFPLATLPETRPETSCLDLVNFFQEGKSHMVLVSQYPGEDHGALGVVTLEDVIEELIGEEIIDESDVYIDVHKAIRRLQPAPRSRPIRNFSPASELATTSTEAIKVAGEDSGSVASPQQQPIPGFRALSRTESRPLSTSPKMTTVMMRRYSTGANGRTTQLAVPVRANIDEMWQHLRHLGPSNRANNPKNTRSTTVKIKPGLSHTGHPNGTDQAATSDYAVSPNMAVETDDDLDAGETTLLLGAKVLHDNEGSGAPAPIKTVPDYGTQSTPSPHADAARMLRNNSGSGSGNGAAGSAPASPVNIPTIDVASNRSSSSSSLVSKGSIQHKYLDLAGNRTPVLGDSATRSSSESSPVRSNATLHVLGELNGPGGGRMSFVRSGSITENIVETRGIRKVVLETTSSAEDDDEMAAVAIGTSVPQRRSLLSAIPSPAVQSANVSDAEDDPARKKKHPETGTVSAPPLTVLTETLSTEAEPSGGVNGSNGAGSANHGGAKKKNRRKKRKGTSKGDS